jgi:peptidoglycan/LPS O-acetylase OafA/YrhL
MGLGSSLTARLLRQLAEVGVQFFFVLSGFLITWLLAREWQRAGRICVGNFYVRRSLRILPPAYVFIAAIAAASALGIVTLNPGDLLHALTFTVNYHQTRAWALGNLWSLGVEEQFYLIWPAVLIWLGPRRAGWVALAVVALDPVLRVVAWKYFPGLRAGIDEQFEMVCDGLATGCVIGLLASRYGISGLTRAIPGPCFALAPLVLLACAWLSNRPVFSLAIGSTLANASIGIMILWCITHADSTLGRLLNSRVAVFAGAISFSLYLWQQIFMDSVSLPRASAFPTAILLSILAAMGSYFLIEWPLQSLRRRHHRTPIDSVVPAA